MVDTFTAAYRDPEEFRSALADFGIRNAIWRTRTPFRAHLTVVRLTHLKLLLAVEQLPRTVSISPPSTEAVLFCPIQSRDVQIWDGSPIPPASIVGLLGGRRAFWRTVGPTTWNAIVLDAETWRENVGRDGASASALGKPSFDLRLPYPTVLQSLLSLSQAATRVAARRPDLTSDPEIRRGLEQEILDRLRDCIKQGRRQPATNASARMGRLMRRFDEAGSRDGLRTIDSLVRKLRVPKSALVAACKACTGMTPGQYAHRRWRSPPVRSVSAM